MFAKNNPRNIAAIIFIGFISGLYFFKYSAIYLKYPAILTALYLIVFVGAVFFLDKIDYPKIFFINQKFVVVISSFLCVISILWIALLPRFGGIGRQPAIEDWLGKFFSGIFPYGSRIAPSGFPILFFLAAPFYFLKNVGYLEAVGLALFLFFVIYFSRTIKENLFRIIVLLLCPAFYYGFAVSDELFFNMMIIIMLIFMMEKFYDPDKQSFKFDLLGILFGLALSTRSVVAIVYAVYLTYKFKASIPKGITFTFLVILVFWFTLLPFFLWDQNSFIANGPFAIQSYVSFLPLWNIIIITAAAVILGWLASNLHEVFFSAGLMLFIPVFLSMLYKIFAFGFYNALVNDIFDHSYFIFSIPFFLLSLQERASEEFIGNILTD